MRSREMRHYAYRDLMCGQVSTVPVSRHGWSRVIPQSLPASALISMKAV